MIEQLLNHQQKPRPFGMKTRRLNAVTRILMVLFAMLFVPIVTWGQAQGAQYNIWIDGNQLTEFSSIPGVTFTSQEPNSGFLRLDGVNLITIESNLDDLEIYLENSSTISSSTPIVVHDNKKLTFSGTGTLTFSGNPTTPITGSSIMVSFIGQGYYSDTNVIQPATVYPLWVAGMQVTSGSASNILGSTGASPTVIYSPDSKMLILNSATINGEVVSDLDELTIQFSGANTITTSGNNAIYPISTNTTAKLVMESQSGVVAASTLELNSAYGPIQGFATLTCADGTYLASNTPIYYGNDGTVMRHIDPLYPDTHFFATYTYTSSPSYPLWVGGQQVTSASSPIKTTFTPAATASGSNVLLLNDFSSDKPIISNLDNLTIQFQGANVLGSTSGYIKSLNDNASLTLTTDQSGSSLSLSNSTGPAAIEGFSPITLEDVYLESNSPVFFETSTKRYKSDNIYPQDLVFSTVPHYMLWVGCISSGFVQAVDGDMNAAGSLNFNHDASNNTNTLTLKNASVTGFVQSGVGDLTIDLQGNNTITESGSYTSSNRKPISSDVSGTLTFTTTDGTGSLTFLDQNGDPYSSPFDGFTATPTYQNSLSYNSTSSVISAPAVNYDLWIGGVQVTSANASNFYNAKKNGSPTVSFNPNNNTLTLNGPGNIWVSGDEPGIKSGLPNLTIFVAYGTSFQFNGDATKAAFEGVNGSETITFDTDPASPAVLNVSSAQSSIIKNFQTVTYNNGLSLWKKYDIYVGEYDASIRTAPWTGEGTESNPFHITSFADLQQMATFLNNNRIKLNYYFDMPADVDCSGAAAVFPSIGRRYDNYVIHTFSGTFNGNGNKITNLSSSYGLFTHVGDGGTVKNLTLENCTVTGGTSGSAFYEPAVSAGGVVAELRGSSSKIQNCNVTGGSISGGSNNQVCFVGGIVGDLSSGTVEGCVVNNVTISEPDASRTPRQGVGGIVGYLEGSVSGCQVMGSTTISNATSGSNDLYTGAIVGQNSLGTLSNNTYDAGVQVTQNAVTKSGNAQRGTGEADGNGDYDVFKDANDNVINGAVLAGVKKMTLSVSAVGTATVSDYYRVNGNDYYSLPNCSITIKGTPNADYDSSVLTIKDSNNTAFNPGSSTYGADTESSTWKFPMPSNDLDANMDFMINLGKLGRKFTIDDFTYNGSGQAVTEIKTKKTSTSTNEITLSLTNGDVTFVDYLSSTGERLAPTYTQANPPSAAGNYNISIKTGNKTIGSCEVAYKINKASLADATIADMADETYTGSAITPKPTVTFNGKTLTAGTDFDYGYANNMNAAKSTDSPAPTVTITGKDGNFLSSTSNSKTFTINPKSVAGAVITLSSASSAFNGTAQVPTISSVTLANVPLTSDVDYTVKSNAGGKDVGPYDVVIQGKGNYDAATEAKTTFTIVPCSIAAVTIDPIPAQTYNGSPLTPTPTAYIMSGTNKITLAAGTDFDCTSYANNTNAAKANDNLPPTVTITGKGNYNGSRVVNFTINKASLADATIADMADETYTGSAITPKPTVTFNGKTLTAGTDFDYGYTNNMNAAKSTDSPAPTVTITGKDGNFLSSTSNSKTFTINPKSVASAVVTLSSASSAFNGTTQVPTISSVSVDNVPLTSDVDYTVSSNDGGKDVGPYDVVIKGKGNYDAATTAKATFTIVPCSIAAVTIDPIPAQTYNGSPITPTPTAYIMSGTNKITLAAGTDFDCTSYANNTNAALSTATSAPTVTITGKGNYNGTRDVNFTIDQVDLSTSTDITIEAVPDQTYTGSAITPKPTVKFNGKDLVAGAGNDFVYGYLNNTKAALSTDPTAPPTVTITGNGNFKNSTSTTFTILDRTASVTFNSGQQYKTFYSAGEDLLVPDDMNAYVVTSASVASNTVNITPISYIHADVPVLLEASSGAKTVKNPNESLPTTNLLKYASKVVTPDGGQYVLYSDEFVKVTSTSTIPAGKVYLDLTPSNARTLVIVRNNAATGVDTISNEAADGEDKWYDMQGRKINKPSKTGLYIKNGKKVVVNNK